MNIDHRVAATDATLQQLTASAAHLRALHLPGRPLVLVNVWDAASACEVAAAGAAAIGTSSAAIAASIGVADDNTMPPAMAFAAVARIAASVDVPVTADLEAGYGLDATSLVEQLLVAGAVGLNLEDSDHAHPGHLRDADEVAQQLAAVREASRRAGVEVVVNARIDAVLRARGAVTDEVLDDILRRGRRYLDAGADCVYPIGLTDPGAIRDLVAALSGPVNANLGPDVTVADLAATGVSRISIGPMAHRLAMADLARRASGLLRPPGRLDT